MEIKKEVTLKLDTEEVGALQWLGVIASRHFEGVGDFDKIMCTNVLDDGWKLARRLAEDLEEL